MVDHFHKNMEVITRNIPMDVQKLFQRSVKRDIERDEGYKISMLVLIRRNMLDLMQLCHPSGRELNVNSFVRRECDIHTLQINRKPS